MGWFSNMAGQNGSAKTNNVVMGDLPKEKYVGSWLCEKGPYQEYIEALSGSNPSLNFPDPANEKNPLQPGRARVILLDAPAQAIPEFERTDLYRIDDLKKHFSTATHDHDRRRIYLMEGLATDYIATIGGHFFMDPAFFQRQERTCVWSNEFTPTSDALPQPSLLHPNRLFHLQYCELRQFDKMIANKPFFCKRTGRHVGMTAARNKEDSTTGILRRKVTWWSRKSETKGGWDVVILVDPQLEYLNPQPDNVTTPNSLSNSAFQSGYVDFVPPPDHKTARSTKPHPHHSMLVDLCHYYQNHARLLDSAEWSEPTASAIYIKKIVAAHYLQLIDYIKAMLPSLELRLTTAWVEEQDQWKSLQTISRRCGNYRDDIEDTLLSLGYPLEGASNQQQQKGPADWKECRKDFQYIYFRLKILKQRADTLMSAMTGLASIAGNRQNLEEAKRVKRLNLLALLFIPLAYTSSLFSMQDDFAPGMNQFWVYWVSAIGLVAFTFVITWVLDSALDDAAQWKLPFKFWGDKSEPSSLKRKATGFYQSSK
ncbi:hypothetical protein B0J11DRAFT_327271 [Dendryphion nanum]|uniref:Uncharacterized protein n=1 Tax=Dendryphion nanum TaxID=256645 RepID=A0A9P9DNP3_9PLEO|nr:hypothetical protein B0J11DRAFT_327271 [Dendryphion nanum]